MTTTTYQVKQFYVDTVEVDGKRKKKIIAFHQAELVPQGTIPMPDSEDPEITKKLKICLRPLGTKKWSEEFKIPIVKSDKLKCNENILWNHYNTQTIMRKESTENKNVFNLLLLPSLVITNCLPMSLDITISLVTRPGDGDDTQSMNASQISES